MAAFPELPGELRAFFPNSFWNWWQALRTWLLVLSDRLDAIDGGVSLMAFPYHTIQFRRGTAAEWLAVDPVLAQGELGYEHNTGKFKIGDGVTVWSLLDYAADAFAGDLTGTPNQITVTDGAGAVIGAGTQLSLPQNIHTGATPQFGGLRLLTDLAKAIFGAGSDMSVWYDGTDGRIETDDVAPSDLVVACGAAKTIELANVVYDDLPPVPILAARLGSTAPTLAAFVGGTEQYTFDATNDYVIGATEITHKYKEGTNIEAHIHWATNGVNAGDTGVKWSLEYTVANVDEVAPFASAFGATAILTIDTLIPAATADRSHILSVFAPAITGASIKIGAYICWKLSRIASATAAPASDPFALAVGFHVQMDTMGSRTVSSK